MDPGRFVLSDTVWAKIEALLPGKKSDRGVTAKDNRLFLEAVLWRARAGLPWRDLPPEFGHWNSVFTRFRRWVRAMVFERIFKALSGEPIIGAKPRADSTQAHIVPQFDDKKWRNSVPLVPIASACCTCVPGLLPHLPSRGSPRCRQPVAQRCSTRVCGA